MKHRLLLAALLAVPLTARAAPDDARPRASLPRALDAWQGLAGEPGSGLARDRTGPGDPRSLKAPEPRRARTPEELAGLATMEQILARYRNGAKVANDTLARVLAVEAEQGRSTLLKNYGTRVTRRRDKARQLRTDAIVRYEKFLSTYPDDPSWTPEILFRLAELLLAADADRFTREEEAYDKALAEFEARTDKKPNEAGPAGPKADYTRSIALFYDLLVRFPDYVHADAALYMVALLRFEEERFDDARQSLLALACADRYPVPLPDGSNVIPASNWRRGDYESCAPRRADSKYISEAWLRVGEIHYDLDQLSPALAAYTEAARDTTNQFYDEALLRIAWTLYLQRKFPEAAGKLDEFVRFADAIKATDPENTALSLRDDGIRYIAKCYLEDDWDLDGNPDVGWGLPRLERDYQGRGSEPHVPEIYAALGDLFGLQTDYRLAIKIYDTALQRWPTAAAAPSLQKKVLDAHVALGDQAAARGARDLLASNYLRGTPWFYANESDTEAIEAAMKLVEDALVASAVERHAYAQSLRSAGDPRADAEYRAAALAYEAYLARYPDTPSSYQYRYDYADCLFYSGQFLPASQAYTAVRDSNLGATRQVEAAEGVVLSLEALVEEEQKATRLALPDLPKQGVAKGPFEPKEMPALVLALQSAYDRLVLVSPGAKEAGAMMYKAGALAQRYYHFEDAEDRFVRVVDGYCGDNIAINAGFAIVDGRVVREDLKGAQEWTEKLLEKACGSGEDSAKFAGDLKTLGNAVRFQEANQLFEAGEFEAAADRYVALVTGAPKDPNADRALNNAAVAYEKIGRFGSASKTYERIYKDYADSEFADDALLRSGLNHVRFFEFDDAVQSYLVLADDKRYKDSEHRLIALKNAADLLDNLQQYPKSSTLFVRYAAETTDPKEAVESTFRAAQVLRKTEDYRAAEAAFAAFLAKYGQNPIESARSVEAHLRIGQMRAARGDRSGAEKAYRDCIALFTARGLQMSTDAADYPAEAQFMLSEYSLSDLLEFKLQSTGKKLAGDTKILFDRVVLASKSYDAVLPYRRIDWVLTAMFRRGYAFETTAIKMREAPVPRELKQFSEPWFAYKDLVEQGASKFESMAIPLYEETIKRAKEYGVANEFTRKALERMNIYKPDQYPLLHDPAVELQLEDRR